MMVMVNNDDGVRTVFWEFLFFFFSFQCLRRDSSCCRRAAPGSKAQLIKFRRSSSFESSGRNRVPLIRFRDKKKTDKSCGKIIRRRCSSFEWMMMRRPITSREMMETIICIS